MTNATGDLGGGLYRLRQTAGYLEGEPSNANLRDLPPDEPRSLVRFQAVLGMLVAFGLILAVQLVRYQVFAARSLPSQSNNVGQAGQGWTADEKAYVDPEQPRGTIVDRLGHPLALDSYYYQVAATPNIIKDARLYAATVAPWVGMDPLALEHMLAENADAAYLPLGLVGPAVGEEIMAMDVFTVTAQPLPKRYYPEGRMAAHVLGFVAGDRRGYYGLEGYYDTFLRANNAILRGQATATHDDRLPDSPFTPSYVQRDLVLTLDRSIQAMAEEELRKAIQLHRAEGGSVIVLTPHGSAILAMASWPDFDPNNFTAVGDANAYRNPAVNDPYEPGSVFKLVTYAAALEKGAITPQSKFLDTPTFEYGEREIHNWDRTGHGQVTAAEALAESLNVTTAKIAVKLGKVEFYRAVERFGFGQFTGVELAGEHRGWVKIPGKEGWYPADLAINSFGQGISVTPLQMANAVAAIASDGVLYRAHVVGQVVDGERVVAIEPQALNRVISPATAHTLTRMMVDTVKRTPDVPIEGYSIAGKSGTAEIPLPSGYVDQYTIASFAGFFPADDPQFVILVKLDRPKTSKWATYTAAPVFRSIIANLIQMYSIPPDAVRRQAAEKRSSSSPP
ncbi:MAG: penicillin-binding protein 2 [Caldilineales bacterium]|nr:penicillin-binding protein 2 [Caldilineales bacterium]